MNILEVRSCLFLGTGGDGSSTCVSVNAVPVSPSPCHTERDAFDTLFDHAPDKLSLVKKVSLDGLCFPPLQALLQNGLHAGKKVGKCLKSLKCLPHGLKCNYSQNCNSSA